MKKIIIALTALFALAACEKEIPLKQDEVDPRIVVNSIFTAEDTMWVNLSESRNVLYEGSLPVITNATAQLLDANDNVIGNFIHNGNGKYYTTDVIPASGSVYGLKVDVSGMTSVKAQSVTPSQITAATIDTNYIGLPGGEFEFTITFADDASQENYYRITIVYNARYEDELGNEIIYQSPGYSTQEVYVTNNETEPDGTKYANAFFFSDKTFNGQTISFTGSRHFFETLGEEGSYYVVGIESLSEDLFKYKLSYSKYLEVQGSPFAEPVQVYSNIENGFGIFGGSSTIRDTIFIE